MIAYLSVEQMLVCKTLDGVKSVLLLEVKSVELREVDCLESRSRANARERTEEEDSLA